MRGTGTCLPVLPTCRWGKSSGSSSTSCWKFYITKSVFDAKYMRVNKHNLYVTDCNDAKDILSKGKPPNVPYQQSSWKQCAILPSWILHYFSRLKPSFFCQAHWSLLPPPVFQGVQELLRVHNDPMVKSPVYFPQVTSILVSSLTAFINMLLSVLDPCCAVYAKLRWYLFHPFTFFTFLVKI